jgi:hypothetical protein
MLALFDYAPQALGVGADRAIHASVTPYKTSTPAVRVRSLQLRVLRLGLFQDGDVGVGVFPEPQRKFTVADRRGAAGLESADRIGGCQCVDQPL